MSTNKNKNGAAKNLEKYKIDLMAIKDMPDGHLGDWLKSPLNMHNFVDMFVETARAAPYLMGHIWSIYFPVSIVAIIVLLLD